MRELHKMVKYTLECHHFVGLALKGLKSKNHDISIPHTFPLGKIYWKKYTQTTNIATVN